MSFVSCANVTDFSASSGPLANIQFYVPTHSMFNPLECKGNYSATSNVVVTLAVDGWAVTFGIAMRGLSGVAARPTRSSLYQM